MADLTIKDVRAKFPQYQDLDDTALADALHTKFYADMDRDEFNRSIGMGGESVPVQESTTTPRRRPLSEAEMQARTQMPVQPTTSEDVNPLPDRQLVSPSGVPMVPRPNETAPATPSPAADPIVEAIMGMMAPASSPRPQSRAPNPAAPSVVPVQPLGQGFSPSGIPVPPRPDFGDPSEGVSPFAGEGFGDLANRRRQQFVQGAVETVASLPEAAAIGATSGAQSRINEAGRVGADREAMIAEIVTAMADPNMPESTRRVLTQRVADMREGQGVLAEEAAQTVPDARDTDLFKAGESIRKGAQEYVAAPDPRDRSFWGAVAQGGGNVAGMIATSVPAMVAGPAGPLVVGGLQGAGMNASQVYKEAREAGADETTAQEAARWGAAVGASEIVPITRALKMLPAQVRGDLTNGLMRRFTDIAKSSGEEAAQEYLAQVANNLVAKGYYDPDRGWSEGATEAALVGAVLGGGLGATVAVVEGRDRKPDVAGDDPAPAAPQGGTDAPVVPQPDAPPSAPQPDNAQPTGPATPEVAPEPVAPPAPVGGDTRPQVSATNPPKTPSVPQEAPINESVNAETDPDVEILDEVETVNGESVATGRKVRLNTRTGEVSVIEDTAPQPAPVAPEAAPVAPAPEPSAPPVGPAPVVPPVPDAPPVAPTAPPQAPNVNPDVPPATPDPAPRQPETPNRQPQAQDPAPEVDDFDGALDDIFGAAPDAAPPATTPADTAPETDNRPTGAASPQTEARPVKDDVAVTPNGTRVNVQYAIMDLDRLTASNSDDGRVNPNYPQKRQPRDRSGPNTQRQIQKMMRDFDPRLLGESPSAGDGAPIVDRDGVVESGNGRTMSLTRIYRDNPELAKQYRDHLASQGYPVDGVTKPVLVRVRKDDMTDAEIEAFTKDSNARPQLDLTATERAMSDADAMPDSALGLYRGGDIDAAQNRDFVRAFIQGVVSDNEQASMIGRDGAMSQDAVRRVQGALLAKAYGNADLVSSLIESTDTNIKAIGGALLDVSPRWAQMRAEAEAGQINANMDQTAALIEAVQIVDRARTSGRNVAEFVKQGDLLSGNDGISPMGQRFLSLMFRDTRSWTRPVGRDRMAEALGFYVDEARKSQPGADMFGGQTDPAQTADAARKRVDGEQQQNNDLFGGPAQGDGGSVRPAGSSGDGSADAGPAAPQRGERETGREEGGSGQAVSEPAAQRTGKDLADEARERLKATGQKVQGTMGSASLTQNPDASFNDLMDRMAAVSGLDARMDVANEWVREQGAERQAEMMVLISTDGLPVEVMRGKHSSVSPSPAGWMLMQEGGIHTVTHNHPGGTVKDVSVGFSGADIAIMMKTRISRIVAVAHNGDIHTATPKAKQMPGVASDAITSMNGTLTYLRKLMQAEADAGRIKTEREAYLLDSPMLGRAFAEAGLIDYTYTNAPLSPEMESVLESVLDRGRSNVRDRIRRAGFTITPQRRAGGNRTAGVGGRPQPDNQSPFAGNEGSSPRGDGSGRVSGKKLTAKQRAAQEEARRAEHYTPGNIISGYGGQWTLVLDYDAGTNGSGWSVKVQDVRPDGNEWQPIGPVRSHATDPDYSIPVIDRAPQLLVGPEPDAAPSKRSDKEIADDLNGMFGQPAPLRQDAPALDTAKYTKASAIFRESLAGIDVRNLPRREVFATMIRPLAAAGLTRQAVTNMRPYFDRFLADVEAGRIALTPEGGTDAPSTRSTVESDRGDADVADRLGAGDVPASRGGSSSSTGSRGDAADTEAGQREDGGGVSDSGAAPVGSRGNSAVSGRNGTERGTAPRGDDAGGAGDRKPGLRPDDGTAEDTARESRDTTGGLNDRTAQQAEADRAMKGRIKPADEANIRDSLPLLLPEQQDDVFKIETRFAKPDGHGMLVTNGTGTGKTYTGGGVIKRFAQQGKENTLVVAPSQGILEQWQDALKDLGLTARTLESTDDAGTGITLTTYANLGENGALAGREFDLIVTDESHKLSSNATGDATSALDAMRALSNRPADLWRRSRMVHRAEWDAYGKMKDGEAKTAEYNRLKDREEAEVKAQAAKPRSKVLMLSATPFAYDKNVDYAEGYLFSYPEDGKVGRSNQSGRSRFMVENFGYRIRYHKLTKPEAAVDSGVFEREFHERLKREGVLTGRALDIEADYDRKFVEMDSPEGRRIDAILSHISSAGGSKDKAIADGYRSLSRAVNKKFDYLKRMQLLEALKARASIPDIQKHLDMGRKVVVFHDYNKGGGFNPFTGIVDGGDANAIAAYADLQRAFPDMGSLNFTGLLAPVDAITKAFGKRSRIYNGTVSNRDRNKAKLDFNTDGSGVDVIVVQAAAGEAGISLHDTTRGHQRVLINLGMPVRPTTALQEEGRTRRVGTVSDAPYRYYTTGTTWERTAFAGKIAENSGTVENLALGNEARAIREAFIDAYVNAGSFPPSPEDGKGGKASDRTVAKTSPYEQAKTHYYGRMKTTGRRDQREGLDFYATPEPVGYKMAEWAGIRVYDRVLEPSAGDGAIARYFRGDSDRTIVEPSSDLSSRAQLRAPGARVENTTFEDYHLTNKHDVIVMNPPFGSGGKTAYEHLEKAMRHAKVGGRIVALVPRGGNADKRLADLAAKSTNWRLTADVHMPAVTFEKAGTAVNTRILVFDRYDTAEQAFAAGETVNVNMTGADTIAKLFDRLEGISIPDRPAAQADPADVAVEDSTPSPRPGAPLAADMGEFKKGAFFHSKTGKNVYYASPANRVEREVYDAVLATAKANGGWYSFYKVGDAVPGFLFKTEAQRDAFLADMEKPTVGLESLQQPEPLQVDRLNRDEMVREGEARNAIIAAMMPDMRAELDRLNLKMVRLGGRNRLDMKSRTFMGQINGYYVEHVNGDLEVAILSARDPMGTLHHEALHALRTLNLFTAREWQALEAESVKTWIKQFNIEKRYRGEPPEVMMEEGIAEAFRLYASERRAPANGLIAQAFNKIARFFRAIRNAMSKNGVTDIDGLFAKALSGEIGARAMDPRGKHRGTPRQASIKAMRRLPGRQARANMNTAMGGRSVFIPDRKVWEELTRSGVGVWDRIGNGREAAKDQLDRARVKFQDRFLPVLRAQQAIEAANGQALPQDQNAYITETTFSGKAGRHLFEIDEDYTKPIIDQIAASNGRMDAESVGNWLYARHAVERNAQIAKINASMPDGGSGMTNADAGRILADVAASPDAARYAEIGKLIDGLRERTLKLREDAGLISNKDAASWRAQYKAYVPLKGFADTDHSEATLDLSGVGKRFNVKGPETRRALGRESEAFNPLQAAISQAKETAVRAEKNRVGQSLYELAKANPSKALWEVKSPKTVRFYNKTTGLVETRVEDPISMFMDPSEMAVKVNGEEKRILFNDPRLARAAGSVGADQMGAFIAMMSVLSRWFSMMRTMLNPEFMITNAFRDMTSAQINIQNFGGDDRAAIAKAMVKNWPKAFMGVMGGQKNKQSSEWQKHYAEFDKAGGKVSFWTLEQPEAGVTDLERRINLATGNKAQRLYKAVTTPSAFFSVRDNALLGGIERVNMSVDNAIRLAAFVEARKRGWSAPDAAALAKNLTVNFNRRGEAGATINALFPFYNAAIQGSTILLQAMRSKRVAAIGLGLVVMGVLLDMANAYLSEEDEDGVKAYDKIPGFRTERNLQLMVLNGGSDAASIPMPYGYNVFPVIGQQIGKVIRGVKDPDEALADVGSAILGAFMPIQGENAAALIVPTVLDPVLEMSTNKDWLGLPIRPEYFSDHGPDAYKFYGGASELSKWTAARLNEATGGNVGISGAIDVSPEYLDHSVKFIFGSAGAFWGRSADVLAKVATGNTEKIEGRDIPFYRTLATRTDMFLDRNRYFTFRGEVEEAREAAKALQEARLPIPPDVRKLAGLWPTLREAEKIRKDGGEPYLRFNGVYTRIMGVQGE